MALSMRNERAEWGTSGSWVSLLYIHLKKLDQISLSSPIQTSTRRYPMRQPRPPRNLNPLKSCPVRAYLEQVNRVTFSRTRNYDTRQLLDRSRESVETEYKWSELLEDGGETRLAKRSSLGAGFFNTFLHLCVAPVADHHPK